MFKTLIEFVQELYQTNDFIPLHAPSFVGNEKKYICDTIDSTFVSSVGQYVDQFEDQVQKFTGAEKAVATASGTSALHVCLYMAGVRSGDLVITQALTFVATCNVIHHMGAKPVFVDVSRTSLGLCPRALAEYLKEHAVIDDKGLCVHKESGEVYRSVVAMHTFGHPVELDELLKVCDDWNILLVEDAAESLGSLYKGWHTGTFGEYGAISFNGNKIITTGGGGMILCRNEQDGARVKHLTTTAKKPHPYEFFHDESGFNYRLPNLNAALGCAQMEVLSSHIERKRVIAERYKRFFENSEFGFVTEPEYAKSNYWLNAVICPDGESREHLLRETNENGVMTRPVWTLMHRLPMFQSAYSGDLSTSEWLEACLVNLPSSPANL